MSIDSEKDTRLLCGRIFTQAELDDVKETIELFPQLSFNELALTICEGLDWFTPKGKYKIASSKSLLKKLEAEGQIDLPEIQFRTKRRKEVVQLGWQTEPGNVIQGSVSDVTPVHLEIAATKESRKLWNEYVERYHKLGYRRPFGAYQRYFITGSTSEGSRYLGALLFSASAWALADRDQWIGWNETDRAQRLHLIVNNTRFLIFPWVRIKNLASHALALVAKQIPTDWWERYGYAPVLLETFVDMEHYKGTCYQAANWTEVGQTAGRGRMDRNKQYPSTPKRIYMYPLRSDFRDILSAKGGVD
ncbi:DUF4338 domain-containing protein [Aquibacillus sp. 3ASR75-11]|uniref:DUF4338 domain-containing protein n=1 Tax=Terrihalobacillus insolitus TaxID=2950438 RepID=A0A9X3WVM6_9BACI|nr:DUF4338 domain-containing protein [Terrihalobacillus insolitus]MDC3415276.1 DUF4338 domain-containing protein [Terrihalobacillus insolitus]MDC3424159.1 DUF4338 domain-containing protein [Terrihalobacillus insolitus]